jgi:hypothetical protein
MHRKSSLKKRSSHKKNLQIGSIVSFYNVGERKKVNKAIKGFITRSNKKGREIRLAYATDKGDKLYRIVGNSKKRSSRRSRH